MNGDGASSGTEKRERVAPEVLQAILLTEIETGIHELIELAKLQIAEGQTPSLPLTITTTLRELSLAPPWFSVKLINDGPQTVLLRVNDPDRTAIRVNNGEDINLDFGAPRVHAVFLVTEAATAEVRLIGLY